MGINSFEYISQSNAVVLILGTMPGIESLKKEEYYAHPDNTFWDMIARILAPHLTEQEIETLSYDSKKKLLLENKVALWDVLAHCDRKGSRDIAIRNEVRNDLKKFFDDHPSILTVFFNGQKANEYFMEAFSFIVDARKLELVVLPSSSPSRQLNCFQKLKTWRIILEKTK